MEQIRISQTEAILYVAIINIILGIFLGTFPLIAGIVLKKLKYGVYGFISSIIGGGILGIILSYPIAIIFTWLIIKKSIAEKTINSIIVDDNFNETSSHNSENS